MRSCYSKLGIFAVFSACFALLGTSLGLLVRGYVHPPSSRAAALRAVSDYGQRRLSVDATLPPEKLYATSKDVGQANLKPRLGFMVPVPASFTSGIGDHASAVNNHAPQPGDTVETTLTPAGIGGGAPLGELYTVRPGNSLESIARRHGVSPQEIVALNQLDHASPIYPGQVLRIPARVRDAVRPVPASQPAPSEAPSEPAETANPAVYVVQSGDTLGKISQEVGRSVTILKEVNQLDSHIIHVGQTLAIPETTHYELPGGGWAEWPVSGRSIVKGYKRGHRAIDIPMPVGSPVVAVAAGTVEYAGWHDEGYGYMVAILHAGEVRTVYAHLSRLNVQTGQTLEQGETLGMSGNTGTSTLPHLHLEMNVNKRSVHPCLYLPGGC